MIPARWFPPGSAPLLISRGQAARPLSAQAQHPLASAPGGKREEARLSGAEKGRVGPRAAHFLLEVPTTTTLRLLRPSGAREVAQPSSEAQRDHLEHTGRTGQWKLPPNLD